MFKVDFSSRSYGFSREKSTSEFRFDRLPTDVEDEEDDEDDEDFDKMDMSLFFS